MSNLAQYEDLYPSGCFVRCESEGLFESHPRTFRTSCVAIGIDADGQELELLRQTKAHEST